MPMNESQTAAICQSLSSLSSQNNPAIGLSVLLYGM
jgi:hypothetical protein